jgi:hypothetical protein
MSGMAFKTQIMGMLGGAPQAVELILAGVVRGVAIGAGMEFDHRRSERVSGFQLKWLGLDEHGDANSRRAQFIDKTAKVVASANHVEATLGGSFDAAFGHDAGSVRAVPESNCQHLVGRSHLQIERQVRCGAETVDVVVGHVPPIFAEMGRYAIGAGRGRHLGRAQGIGMRAAARIANGRNVIDVDAQPRFPRHVELASGFSRIRERAQPS